MQVTKWWQGWGWAVLAGVVLTGCVNSTQVKSEEVPEKLIGGDKDDHGCLIGAGYSWCEALGQCIRPWETKCEDG